MCHLFADSLCELHAMAEKLGLKREWFQHDSAAHYDICKSKRTKAIGFGAVSIECRSQQWREVLETAKQQLNMEETDIFAGLI